MNVTAPPMRTIGDKFEEVEVQNGERLVRAGSERKGCHATIWENTFARIQSNYSTLVFINVLK